MPERPDQLCAESVSLTFAPGDVLWYARERDHCREGLALVQDDGRAIDTFWALRYGDSHALTPDELATAEVRFNVNDFDALDSYSKASRATWETYHPADRGRISSQHGLQEELFVRKGATPDLATQIANAEAKVEEAESDVRSARSTLERRREELVELRARKASRA